jgi:hypothetical protein
MTDLYLTVKKTMASAMLTSIEALDDDSTVFIVWYSNEAFDARMGTSFTFIVIQQLAMEPKFY